MIAVCGSAAENARLNALAEEVGRRIALAGVTLVCGGRGGVMTAACRGAMQAGGLTVGILPGDEPRAANPFVQVAIATGAGHARNVMIVQSAAAVIAIGGEYGTLSEIAIARKCGRRVIGLESWELGNEADGIPRILPAHTPAEAVALALQHT
ncbi:TIGR00725 family protein [Candidatus Gracilibacteria bacterium]|nr:TIGR00725 family protein [Candidatus Gracilibacteria bacterium]